MQRSGCVARAATRLAACVLIAGVLLPGTAARPADPPPSATVPNLGISSSTTVASVKSAYPAWTFVVVKKVGGDTDNLIVDSQFPEQSSVLEVTQGQIMHLLVSGSNGPWNDVGTLQKAVIVQLVIIVIGAVLCWRKGRISKA